MNGLLIALLLNGAGMATLSAAMDRHWSTFFSGEPTRGRTRALRLAAAVLLTSALQTCIWRWGWGWGVGLVLWLCLLSLGALGMAVVHAYRPNWAPPMVCSGTILGLVGFAMMVLLA